MLICCPCPVTTLAGALLSSRTSLLLEPRSPLPHPPSAAGLPAATPHCRVLPPPLPPLLWHLPRKPLRRPRPLPPSQPPSQRRLQWLPPHQSPLRGLLCSRPHGLVGPTAWCQCPWGGASQASQTWMLSRVSMLLQYCTRKPPWQCCAAQRRAEPWSQVCVSSRPGVHSCIHLFRSLLVTTVCWPDLPPFTCASLLPLCSLHRQAVQGAA
jgi:hypothetical protein